MNGRCRVALRRLTGALAVLTVAAALPVLAATPAVADTAPPVPGTPPTVSADVLPTVQVNGVVWAQVVVGRTVYVTGEFTSARPAGAPTGTNESPRSHALAYDVVTGALLPWAPALNAQGLALVASADGSTIYLGGDFTSVSGVNRFRLVGVDAVSGAVVPRFTPGMNARVRSLAISGGTLYAGGIFTTAAGLARTRLAAFSTADGAVLPWAPSADAEVMALVAPPTGGKVVVGGRFTTLNGEPVYGLGALDTATGSTLPFAVNAVVRNAGDAAAIYSLQADATQVYGTGYTFGSGGNLESSFAADAATGALVWVSGCRGDTYSGAPIGGVYYIVGHPHDCSQIGAFPQTNPWTYQRAIALGTGPAADGRVNTGGSFAGRPAPEVLHWLPTLAVGSYTGQDQAAWSVAGTADYVVLAGEFPSINGVAQQGLARFARTTTAPNREGPQGYSTLTPALSGIAPGTVRATWTAAWDRDNTRLTYELLRGATLGTAVVVDRRTLDTTWWKRPTMLFTDTGAPAGSTQSYRVRATDPFGNTMVSTTAAVAVPAGAAPGASSYREAVRADAPTHYWRLGESGGTTAFNLTGPADLTLTGSPQLGAPGALAGDTDTAVVLPGTATVPASTTGAAVAGPQTFSVEAWFRTTTTRGGKIIGFGNRNDADSTSYDRHLYMTDGGQLVLGVSSSGMRTVTSPIAYNDGRWHHVVGALGAGGLTLFVDGRQVAGRADTTGAAAYNGYWRVGGDQIGTGWPSRPTGNSFAGSLDEVAVYPTALSAQAVTAHWDRGRGVVPNQAPTAAFTSTATNLTVAVDAAGSTDADGTISGHAWNFGDGTTGTGATAQHTYITAGTYTVTLTVTDDDGATATATRSVVATNPPPPNQPPTASFAGAVTDRSVALDATASTDPDGTISGHAWNFGDGTTGTGATAQHTYAAAGTYTVTLTVTDDDGATATATRSVVATNPSVGATVAVDAFGRTVAAGFGTADAGGAWTATGSGTAASVDAGSGRVSVGAGRTATLRLPSVLQRDVDVRHSVWLEAMPTGGGSYLSTTVRSTAGGDYRARTRVLASGEVQISLTRVVGGTETVLTGSWTVPGLTWTTGTRLLVRAQATGSTPTTLQMKVWTAGTAEPAWQRTVTDTTPGLQQPGAVGLVSYLSGSATATLANRVDDLVVTLP